jgi:hypothetical protein
MFDYTTCTNYADAAANLQCICNAYAANITAVPPPSPPSSSLPLVYDTNDLRP